jgi:hypothetical protein
VKGWTAFYFDEGAPRAAAIPREGYLVPHSWHSRAIMAGNRLSRQQKMAFSRSVSQHGSPTVGAVVVTVGAVVVTVGAVVVTVGAVVVMVGCDPVVRAPSPERVMMRSTRVRWTHHPTGCRGARRG